MVSSWFVPKLSSRRFHHNLPSSLLEILEITCSAFHESKVVKDSEAKCIELVMKCLWKLTKTIADDLGRNSLKVAPTLQSLHHFLSRNPPSVWRRKLIDGNPNADLPLRTIKTIIHELVLALGPEILPYLTTMNILEDTPLVIYIKAMLSHLDSSDHSIPKTLSNAHSPEKIPDHHHDDMSLNLLQNSIPSYPPPSTQDIDTTIIQSQLNMIFEKIRSKDTSQEVGLSFHVRSIEVIMRKFSEFSYIRDPCLILRVFGNCIYSKKNILTPFLLLKISLIRQVNFFVTIFGEAF